MPTLRDFVQDHLWWTGLAIFIVAFVANGIRRLMATEARMSTEEKLELRLHRAAMALRKLGRAKRLLSRYVAIRAVASTVPMPGMVRRLWCASSDAGDAVSHLTAVLKKISDMGASPRMLASLDRSITEARGVQEACRSHARSLTQTDHPGETNGPATLDPPWRETAVLLKQVQTALDAWHVELTSAEANLSRTMDPTVLRSGGVFRNPFKPETSVEDAQTRSVLALRQSQEDLYRAECCATSIQHTLEQYVTYQG